MPEIRYRTSYGNKIDKIEVERSTDKSVWVKRANGGVVDRYLINSEDYNFHKTWEEAHKHLIEKHISKVERLKKETRDANYRLLQIDCMVDPG